MGRGRRKTIGQTTGAPRAEVAFIVFSAVADRPGEPHPPRSPLESVANEGVTPKRRDFVADLVTDLNGKQVPYAPGYSPRTARAQATRLLTIVPFFF